MGSTIIVVTLKKTENSNYILLIKQKIILSMMV